MLVPPKDKDRRCGFVVNGPVPGNPDDLPTRICDLRVPRGILGFSEGEANAKLIAAAPELLELVRSAFDRFTDNDMQPPNHLLQNWLDSARAAISKATS